MKFTTEPEKIESSGHRVIGPSETELPRIYADHADNAKPAEIAKDRQTWKDKPATELI
jgi:hypothetical protein